VSENHSSSSTPLSQAEAPTVFVVDDEEGVRSLLVRTCQRAGIHAEGFRTAEEFLAAFRPEQPGCLLLDVTLPGMSGLQLQQALRERNARIPIIFLTGSADVNIATAGMRAGAVDLLEKPFEGDVLFARLHEALDLDRQHRQEEAAWREINSKVETLTARERQVLEHLVAGHANKIVALLLNTSPRTVEVHRARIMRKMKVDSLAELVRQILLWRKGNGPSGG